MTARDSANGSPRAWRMPGGLRPVAAAVATLVGLGLGLSFMTSSWVFPLYSLNHDEPMYVLQSKMLRRGELTLPAKHAEFVRPWAAGARHGRIVMKYAPPWPTAIALADALFSSRRAAPALAFGAAVLLVHLLSFELFRSRRAAILTAGLFVLSPVVIVQSGTFLPYLFQLVLELTFAVLLLSGLRRASARRLVLAGAPLGVAIFSRPADALFFAVPFLALFAYTYRHQARLLARRAALVAVGAAPAVSAALLYNVHTMGSPWRSPYNVTGRFDTFGFGRRGTFTDNTFQYGFHEAVRALDNLWSLPGWTFGGVIFIGLALIGLVTDRATGPRAWAVAALAVTIPTGYFFFWSPFTMAHVFPGLASLGPYYHLPVIVPLVIFGGRALDRALLSRRWGPRTGRLTVGALAMVMVGVTAAALPSKISLDLETTDDLRAASNAIPVKKLGRAIVFLPERPNEGAASHTPFLQDSPPLTGRVVFASDLGPRNLGLLDQLPARVPYRLDAELAPAGQLFSPQLRLARITRYLGARIAVRAFVQSPRPGACITAYASAESRERSELILDRVSSAGQEYETTWTFAEPRTAGASQTPVVPAVGTGYLTVGVEVGPTCGPSSSELYERRFAFRSERAGLRVIGPGYGWHRVRLPGREPFWVREQVDPTLSPIVLNAEDNPLNRTSAPRR